MRIWTLHPKYLDPQGLVALWREALLAQKVLQGKTKGYRNHPQLFRFGSCQKPTAAVAAYLLVVQKEASRRGYKFDASKITSPRYKGKIKETKGQLIYEWNHLKKKLRLRSPHLFKKLQFLKLPETHPLFQVISGPIRDWEHVR